MKTSRITAFAAGIVLAGASALLGSAAAFADDGSAEEGSPVAPVSCSVSDDGAGTTSQKCDDGSYSITYADGSSEWSNGTGCVVKTDADGNVSQEGECPLPTDGGFGGWVGGCATQLDDAGNPQLDDAGNPIVACMDGGPQCADDAPDQICAIAYSSFPGREDCPTCRNVTMAAGAPEAVDARALNTDALAKAAAAVDKAKVPSDQGAAIEAAAGKQPAVTLALAASGASKGAGPIAPVTLAVIGVGLVGAGYGVWRQLARVKA
jgi:hypothetical protein